MIANCLLACLLCLRAYMRMKGALGPKGWQMLMLQVVLHS